MTLNEMIVDVRFRLDEIGAGDEFWTDEEITLWLNEANIRVAKELEDIEHTFIQDGEAGQSGYPLPSDYLRLQQAVYDGLFLKPISQMELRQYASAGNPISSQTGTPERYYIRANTIWLFPAPVVDLTNGLELWYYGRPLIVSETAECEHDASLHYLLPIYACYLGFQKDLDVQESQTCKRDFEAGILKERENLAAPDGLELEQIYDPGD